MAGEVIQNGLCPDSAASGRNEREPVDNTRAVLASISGAVKAALGVDGKLPHARKHAVFRCVAEAVQDALFPGGYPRSPGPYRCGLQFVDGAATVVGGTYRAPAAVLRGAVKISGAADDEAAIGFAPVPVAVLEVLQYGLSPFTVLYRTQFEHGPV